MRILPLRQRARWSVKVTGAVVALAALGLSAALPGSATAVPPVLQKPSAAVTADALPTVQLDGVVWTQTIVGNTVFAGGQFAAARPAGAAPGTQTVRRSNLLSYNLRTGALRSFAPTLNGQVRALAVSPNKKILYVGGDFTTVNAKRRPGLAAFEVSTGRLLKTALGLNNRVNAIVTSGDTVYFGGWFTRVGNSARQRVAALNAKTGKLTAWNPSADGSVDALVVTPNKSRIVLAGTFGRLGGKVNRGMGAVTTGAGSVRTWKANTKIRNYGGPAGIRALAVDRNTVYGAAWGYEAGNFEGIFAASPTDGAIRWLQDCHGDQYSVAAVGNLVYSVGHAHFCRNIGGFPEVSPQRMLVVSKAVRGTVATNTQDGPNYRNWAGYKAPALYNWFPNVNVGTITKQNQGAWSLAATSKYVVVGGEFTTVNGRPQQGLVRFTTPANLAPRKMGPRGSVASMTPSVGGAAATGVRLGWSANYDLDDRSLRYQVIRDGRVIATFGRSSTFWRRPWVRYTDRSARAGQTYAYQVRAIDRDGNRVTSPAVTKKA